ncbi:putative dehydrogenase [Scopulibacillus darangshiensis]|uniref:Putative dehydrogenase n=1 Tax=Scopulibacillus darangshiensis TaxID=442528 RepID=A0A4R2NQ66_9BACL|nr:Gfo/Idh/MocA family oxidoreductase [Scopulibacillus darangshiensis]TCP23518.1 putative dehydrogenase [Scopulibacillus darangshiensis]
MQTIGIIMNGVTGRMGTRQHLERSIIAIREQGGVLLPSGDKVMPDPILVGRDESKLRSLAQKYSIKRWSTDLEECLADPYNDIYFDSQTTIRRAKSVRKAIEADKHVYCEKPTGVSLEEAMALAQFAHEKGVKNGVVQDKLFLPGLLKLKRLVESGYFGRILSVRGEFGYWVFEGDVQESQRPSWNYRREEGGGIIVDMLCHWRYVLDNLFGGVKAVSCHGATHIPERWDEADKPYKATADDSAYSTFELEGGIVAHINSSWCVRVKRDELFELQVDGTEGSAVAGLRQCKIQPRASTPKAIWNPDISDKNNYREQWLDVPLNKEPDNAFKIQWEMFLKHVAIGTPFPYDLLQGAKGVQLAGLGKRSWQQRRWIDVPELKLEQLTGKGVDHV